MLPTWEELGEVVAAARERDAVVHFDGARLWESTVHFGRSLDEIAGLADSVYVSYYKSLDGYGGAALVGPGTLVEEAKVWRHRYGGTVFQQFPTVLSALAGLERELPRLPSYVGHARVVADALREGFEAAGLPWSRIHPERPHTNEFQVWLPYGVDVLTEASLRQGEETKTLLFARPWDEVGPGLSRTEVDVRAAGLDWTAQEVRAAVAAFALLPGRRSRRYEDGRRGQRRVMLTPRATASRREGCCKQGSATPAGPAQARRYEEEAFALRRRPALPALSTVTRPAASPSETARDTATCIPAGPRDGERP